MVRIPRKRHIQLTLDQARKPVGHGGWRPGAGRPKGRTRVSHEEREHVGRSHPQHVTLRIVADVASLRRRKLVRHIREAIAKAHRDDFRIVHFSVQGNHLHLMIEAEGLVARARGLQGLEVRIARRVNAAIGRTGALFADRYHSRALRTPREVRNALCYVLNNARHHAGSISNLDDTWIDPCSSAAWFDGWADAIEGDTWWKRELLEQAAPTAAARTWLLSTGWRGHGLLRFDEVPGPRR